MSQAYNTVSFIPKNCDGCGDCMTACAKRFSAEADIAQSRIKIVKGAKTPEIAICRQCGDPKCVMNCPAAALSKNEQNGVIDWDSTKCVDCLLCTVGCAFGGIVREETLANVTKCDQCGGDPLCVKACPHDALRFYGSGNLYNEYGQKEDLFAPGLAACQGCYSEMLIRHTLRAVGPNTVLAAPPGCIPGMGTVGYNGRTGCKVPIFHPLLTNTASMLAGIKKQYQRKGRDITMLALAGDGGASDVGFQSLSGAAERNDPLLFVCVDNEGYMNTGMQASGSTSYGSWTSTTPVGEKMPGKQGDAKNMPVIMMMHNCNYVATASPAFMDDYYAKLKKAIEVSKTGMAYLHVYAPCPTGWRFGSHLTTEVCRRQVETNFITLWEYEKGQGLHFNREPGKARPIKDYIELIGKYKHLKEEQVAYIQKALEDRIKFLQRFAASN